MGAKKRYGVVPGGKPRGGFIQVHVTSIAALWSAVYGAKGLKLFDIRVWLAAQELACGWRLRKENRKPSAVGEGEALLHLAALTRLLGVQSEDRLKRSLNVLERHGFMELRKAHIQSLKNPGSAWFVKFAKGATAEQAKCPHYESQLERMTDGEERNLRLVPVPRQLVRLCSKGLRKSTLAALLGHLLRCVYFSRGVYSCGGLCSAEWIAQAFGIHTTSAERGRAALMKLGVLAAQKQQPHWRVVNEQGRAFLIHPDWAMGEDEETRSAASEQASESTNNSAVSATPTAAVCMRTAASEAPICMRTAGAKKNGNQSLSEIDQHQNHGGTAPRPPSGACASTPGGGLPTWKNITPQDLGNISRLLVLYNLGRIRGIIKGPHACAENMEAPALRNFVATAIKAREQGRGGGAAFFVKLIKDPQWDPLTESNTERAHRMLKGYFFGAAEKPVSTRKRSAEETLSVDSIFVRRVLKVTQSKGFEGDPFEAARGAKKDFTRARWEAALRELQDVRRREAAKQQKQGLTSVSDSIGSTLTRLRLGQA